YRGCFTRSSHARETNIAISPSICGLSFAIEGLYGSLQPESGSTEEPRASHALQEKRAHMSHIRRVGVVSIGLALYTIVGTPAFAQLNTQHIKGTVGLKGGSQPPPNIYVIAPLIYLYNTDTVKDANGNALPVNTSVTSTAFAGGFNVVTTKKVLGGLY